VVLHVHQQVSWGAEVQVARLSPISAGSNDSQESNSCISLALLAAVAGSQTLLVLE